MDNKLQALDFIIIGFLMLLSSSTGIFFRFTGGRQKTLDEYLMGDRQMQTFPVSVSLMAAFMSANSMLGTPSETYLYGTQYTVWMIGSMIGALIVSYGFLPVFFAMNIDSVNEYLGMRFGSTTRTIVAFLQVIRTIFYSAVVLYSPSLALNVMTGIPIWIAAISIASVCTFYCTMGGTKAVVWTDLFQAFLMYITLIAVIAGGSVLVGFFETIEKAKTGGRFIFFDFRTSLTERYTFWNSIIYGVISHLMAFGTSQTELQRILSQNNLKKGQMSVLLGTIYCNIFYFLCIWSGIVLYAMYENCDPMLSSTEQTITPDQLMPLTIMKLFGGIPGLAGLCVAGIFSASLSSVSSCINALSSMTVEDFLKPFSCGKNLSQSGMACTAKLLAALFGVFCLLLSFMVANFRGVMEATTIMGGMIGGPVCGVFILGLFCKYVNQYGALFSLVSGSAFGLWAGFGSYITKANIETLQRSTSECILDLNKNLSTKYIYRNDSLTYEGVNKTVNSFGLEERYIFPLYEISYIWIPLFASLVSVITGIIASLLASCFLKIEVDHQKLSKTLWNINFISKVKSAHESTSRENLTSTRMEQRNFNTIEDKPIHDSASL